MRDQLQAVEKELALARVELAKKNKIYKSQRICIGIDRHGREEMKETTEPSRPIPTTHDDNNKSEAKEEDLTSHQNQFTQTTVEGHQTTSNQESPDNQQDPANSTLPIDLGFPIMCNLCSREISSKNFFRHCSIDHNIERPNFRRHAVKINAKLDSIYQNYGKLKPGVVVASDDGDYIILEQPTILGWSTTNINTKETKDLELVRDMAEMRYLGRFDSKTEEGIFITDDDNKVVFIEFGAYCKKIFFTAQTNYHEENVFVVNIPRSRHGEPACVAAKQKELRDYENFEVFEVVDSKEASNNVIATEWVLIEKEKHDGTKVTKARLCLSGDMEKSLHTICRESPTVNKISVKILLFLAVSQG